MFHRFLQIVKNGSVQSQYEIATQLGVSPLMVVQIARELTKRGYLQNAIDDCASDEGGCKGCALGGSCHVNVHSWILTEKGEKAVCEAE
jgi:hypothetical protein